MHKEKYDMRQDNIGWTVYEIETDLAAISNGEPLIGLDVEAADDLVDLLNRMAAEADAAPKH